MYVKNTSKIFQNIESKIETLFATRTAHASDWHNYGFSQVEFDQLILNHLIPPEIFEQFQQWGDRFFTKRDNLTARLICTLDEQTRIAEEYVLKFTTNIFMPDKWYGYYVSQRPEVDHPIIASIVQQRHEAIEKLKNEKVEFIANVKKMYDSVPSINALRKLWPPIDELLDPDVVSTCEAKTKPTKIERPEVYVDPKQLSATLLKAKITA